MIHLSSTRSALSTLALVTFLLTAATGFSAYAQTPTPTPQITSGEFVDALNTTFGKQTTQRATHAKGIVLLGKFSPSAQAASVSKAPHFKNAVPVTVRFSDNTGIQMMPDSSPHARPHGLAIRFQLPDGTATDLVTHSYNGFPAKTPEDMRQFLLAVAASGQGVASPTPIEKYIQTHPAAKAFATGQDPAPVSYAAIPYFGVNSFKFVSADGKTTFGRYQIIPEIEKHFLSKEEVDKASNNYLMDEIRSRVEKGAVRFKLVLQLAAPGDKIDDPSVAWANTNKTIELGVLEIASVASDPEAADHALVFIPSMLPDGIEPADPMIRFRGVTYPVSYDRRHP